MSKRLATHLPSLAATAVLAALAANAAPDGAPSPYGVCAHLQRHADSAFRQKECAAIADAGIRRVRFDLEWWRVQKGPDAPFDFSYYDGVVADIESSGLVPLPILNIVPGWATPIRDHLGLWEAFVEATVGHFGERFPEIEILNETNLGIPWGGAKDPAEYALVLRASHGAAKRGAPRILFGGTAGCDLGYIRGVYEAGGGPFFDAMSVHPYTHPWAPEGKLDADLGKLRSLMAEFGDENKPVVLTEMGWPTHRGRVDGLPLLRAALHLARPERKTWRCVFAATNPGADGGPPRDIAESIGAALPSGSSCEACFGARLRERLAAGDVDAVVYPFDESFPVDTFEEVRAFVERGGVLVDFGGMPMYFRVRETAPGVFAQEGQDDEQHLRTTLRVSALGPWMDPALPRNGVDVRAFPTEAAKAAGFQGDPAGERVWRYQTPNLLREGDEFVPLLTFKDANGREVAAASLARLAGGGCVIVAGLRSPGNANASCGEENQARYLVRSYAMALAMGVEGYYWYEFRSEEKDPFYSEHHFGVTHADLSPKPAYEAFRTFTRARPAGSVQRLDVPLRDPATGVWRSEWTRPDGVKTGVVWKTGATERRTLRFDADRIRFRDYAGRDAKALETGVGEYSVPVGESPVFFAGGALKP